MVQTHTTHIFDHTPESLMQLVTDRRGLDWPGYRARQILEWVYARQAGDIHQWTNLSKRDRDQLQEMLIIESGRVVRDQTGSDGTRKLLIEWAEQAKAEDRGEVDRSGGDVPLALAPDERAGGHDERTTECVMIPGVDDPMHRHHTACISSQAGCPVGCRFCASGIGGVDGNLTAGQIVEQVWRLNRDLGHENPEHPRRISHVVFMGMGEPLANYHAVMDAVRTLNAPWGLNISARRITISTVGLPKAIERLAGEELPVTLAISLHAPNDEIRRQLIPWAQYTSISELMQAGQYYFNKTGREVTLEYILLGGVNDRPEHALELAQVARTLRANVNLIRYNEVAGLPFARPGDSDVRRFQEILREKRINAHIRASRGRDIAAACGQLRHEHRQSVQQAAGSEGHQASKSAV